MRAGGVVEVKLAAETGLQNCDGGTFLQANVFVLHRPPQLFDEEDNLLPAVPYSHAK